MIKHGEPPYLECSSLGDRRLSALYARIKKRNFNTIEELYQSAKLFTTDTPGADATGHILEWRKAKGLKAINHVDLASLYHQLWVEYLEENPDLLDLIKEASGLSDVFGQEWHQCQATTLWSIRNNQ